MKTVNVSPVAAPEIDVHLLDEKTDEVLVLPAIAIECTVLTEDNTLDCAPVVWLNAAAFSVHDVPELGYGVLGVVPRGASLDSIGRRRLDALRDGQPAWAGTHRAVPT